MSVPQKSYDEIVDLFARTSSAEVLAFRPSAESQERVRWHLVRRSFDRMPSSPMVMSR